MSNEASDHALVKAFVLSSECYLSYTIEAESNVDTPTTPLDTLC